jgi:hypothetical protein
MTATPRLSRVSPPRYLRQHWRDADPTPWVSAVAADVLREPVVLPLVRLSGSLVFPVLERAQLEGTCVDARPNLEIALVSVSPPARAARELRQLRAYGHSFVLLPSHFRPRFFDLAELDVHGVGVAAAVAAGGVERVLTSGGVPDGLALEPWWRETRENQLRTLARA